MFHYIGLIWNPLDAGQRVVATRLIQALTIPNTHWNRALETNGLTVFTLPNTTPAIREYVLPPNRGIVLGRLFPMKMDTWAPGWEPRIDERYATQLTTTSGRKLMDDFWGTYVAFLRTSDGKAGCVMRDCSGKIPCYRTRYSGVDILFSDISDLGQLELPAFTINYGYLAAFVYESQLQIRECALNEVSEILAGECFERTLDSAHQFSIWNPREICFRRTLEDYDQAMLELRNTTQQCVDAWASVYGSVLHRLSGGFDSAVVLGSLARVPVSPAVVCMNLFTDGTPDDERRYARLAAKRSGFSLLEERRRTIDCVIDSRLMSIPKAPKPTVQGFFRMLDIAQTNSLAKQVGADAVWTGQGGDHIFLQVHNFLAAVDYLTAHGVGFGLSSAIADAARLSNLSYIAVLRSSLRLSRTRAPWKPPYEELRERVKFINRDALPDNVTEYIAHPWEADMEGLPTGKKFHARFIADVLNRHRPIPRVEYAYEHHPLLSQPLIELSLQIPTYLLLRGGRQRALARETFRDRVPEEICRREDKGDAAGHIREALRRSESFLCDILLNGLLVQERVVRTGSLEPYFRQGQPFRNEETFPLLASIAAELWARNWCETSLRVAA